MKKNYFEPAIKVQTIALQSMIAASPGEGGVSEEPVHGGFGTKDNILEGLFD